MINIWDVKFLNKQGLFYFWIHINLPDVIPDLYEEEMDYYSVSTGSSKTKPWTPNIPLCPHGVGLRCDVRLTKSFITDRPCLTSLEPCVVRVAVNQVYDFRKRQEIKLLASEILLILKQ